MNEISEHYLSIYGNALLMGDGDPNSDQVFQVFLMDVKDPAKLCKSLRKFDPNNVQVLGL